MAQQTINKMARTGLNMTTLPVAADNAGDKWANSGREYIEVTNGSGGAVTLTFPIQARIDGQAPSSLTVSVPAGDVLAIGPFPANWYNDTLGNANVTYSSVTSVKIAVVQMIPA